MNELENRSEQVHQRSPVASGADAPPSTGGRALAVIFLLAIGILFGFVSALLLALSPQSPGLVGIVLLQVLGIGGGLVGVIRAKTRKTLLASLLLAVGMVVLAFGLCFVVA